MPRKRVGLNVKPGNSFRGDIAAVLFPMVMLIEISLIGRLFLTEILLVLSLPYLLSKRRWVILQGDQKTLLIMGLCWLLALMLSDVVMGTSFHDLSRGWSKIIFTMLDFISIYLLTYKNPKRILLFVAGIALGQVVKFFIDPAPFAVASPWKFGLSGPITDLLIISAALLFKNGNKNQSVAVAMFGALLNIYLGARSVGAMSFLVALFVILPEDLITRRNRLSKPLILAVFIFLLIGGTILSKTYQYAVENGYLGEAARETYEIQSSGKYGLLIGDRAELLAAVQAIKDSPVLGHGSWAKDPKYTYIMFDELAELGYKVEIKARDLLDVRHGLIPSHSHLFGAWVEAGIAGAIFWIWVLYKIAKTFPLLVSLDSKFYPSLILYHLVGFVWGILFSPFGAEDRVYAALDLVLMFFVWDSSRSISQLMKKRVT